MQWNLIKIRKIAKKSQKDMAEFLNISVDAYGKKERGQLQFTQGEMFAISELFNQRLDDIFLPTNFGNAETATRKVN